MSLVDRFVIGVDIQRYGARVMRRQGLLQRELDRILDEAAEAAGVSRAKWHRVDGGDGEMAVLPADVDLLAIVRRFVSELDLRLADHNEDHVAETRIRLRVAMHSGALTPKPHGYTGPAFIVLQRLLDSAPVRAAMTEVPEAHLAQIISGSVYERAVVPELGGLRPRQFREVKVDLPAKEFHEIAYLHVPNGWPESKQPAFEPARPPFPVVIGQPAPLGEKPAEKVATPVIQPPEPSPGPLALTPGLREFIRGIRLMLAGNRITEADRLTTLAILVSADRANKGWLRESDHHKILSELITELDAAWAVCSSGAWGFHAQRQYMRGFSLPGRHAMAELSFHMLSHLFGWRDDEEGVMPRYSEFVRRASRDVPFYPTLRDSQREHHPTWYDEWRATVLSVHTRLRRWER
jgi:hypothetical protein